MPIPYPNGGVGYNKRSGKARHKWTYRMMRLRNGHPQYNSVLQGAIQDDTTLQTAWSDYWAEYNGQLGTLAIDNGAIISAAATATAPESDYNRIVAGGAIPYDVWSGQPIAGTTAAQARALAAKARDLRARFEQVFRSTMEFIDNANLATFGPGDGGEGGYMPQHGNPPVQPPA